MYIYTFFFSSLICYFICCRPPALHFFAKRRAADPNVTSPAAKTREAARSNTPKTAAGDGAGGDLSSPAGGIDAVGGRGAGEDGGQEREEREEQDIDQVVYYYDVATVWVRPVDLKVSSTVLCMCVCVVCALNSLGASPVPQSCHVRDGPSPPSPRRNMPLPQPGCCTYQSKQHDSGGHAFAHTPVHPPHPPGGASRLPLVDASTRKVRGKAVAQRRKQQQHQQT